ncbi:MAG: hypothetical protein WDO56_31035 [Gammaproteobacteria bacterium]
METGEELEDFLVELRRCREEMSLLPREERDRRLQKVRDEQRARGDVIIDSEDHPLHPRNLERRWAEQGIFWAAPEETPSIPS